MLVNNGYVVCHNTVLTYRHALFLFLLLASKKDKLNSRQRVICIDSACHMSNGCLTPTHPGCQWCTSKVEPVLKIKASANSNSVAWEGTWGYSPLGLIIKLLIWPLHTIISNRFAHHQAPIQLSKHNGE